MLLQMEAPLALLAPAAHLQTSLEHPAVLTAPQDPLPRQDRLLVRAVILANITLLQEAWTAQVVPLGTMPLTRGQRSVSHAMLATSPTAWARRVVTSVPQASKALLQAQQPVSPANWATTRVRETCFVQHALQDTTAHGLETVNVCHAS
mmetsp:Transcript_39307/g.90817  ORF Transcript_39307/g.90817 Transcript_39307/m.90817 type:complete len:149 (+) Transcript_39307:2132-2578(+)